MDTRTWTRSAIALLALASAARAQQITLTELPLLPGGTYASAYAINDTGKIVGVANDATGAYKNVQWLNGQISIIPEFTGGAGLSVPEDLNDAGDSAGHQHVYGSINYAVWWDSLNNPSALPGIPGGSTASNWAHAINGMGQIVGYSQEGAPNNRAHAVVWLQGAVQIDLGFMGGGTYSEAYGINDLGAVVGAGSTASASLHAFLWQNGQYTDLSTWTGGGVASKAYAINNQGDIVGLNANVASLWRNGAVQALPMPPGISAYTPAIDINDAGDIIATGSKGYPIEVGVLWHNGIAIDLGTLPGGTISRARRINAAGEIVGEAQSASGYFHAVKWTTAPTSTPYCFGDGSGLTCPCGNNGTTGNGCANSLFGAGANLGATGRPNVVGDDVRLAATGVTGAVAVFFQGATQTAATVIDDGIGCVGGPIIRLGSKAIAGNTSSFPQAGDPSISVRGAIPAAGGTYFYQCFYRNATSAFCPPATSNRTNASSIQWFP